MNNRRELMIAIGAGALAAPLNAIAQQPTKTWRIGFMTQRNRPASFDSGVFGAFLQGMRELGYVAGKNLLVEWRFTEGRDDLAPVHAAELVRLNVDLIVTTTTATTHAAQKATTTIPIVMASGSDPVGNGFVKSLARPGGNITGLTNIISELVPKHLEMILSMVPKLSRVAALVNPGNASHAIALKNVKAAAQKVKVMVVPVEAGTAAEIEQAFSAMARGNTGAVIVVMDAMFNQHARRIAELAMKNRLPSIAASRESADAGVLMTYGTNIADLFRRSSVHVDKILKGRKPADLPVEQPTIFELFINGKTAKALGLKIPYDLQILADKVID